MDVHDQFMDPTTVTHSLVCNLTSWNYKTLVVVKNTLLQLFKIGNGDKLILIEEYKLNGSIQGIQSINFHQGGRSNNTSLDHLLILTKFAKLSIISWDQSNHTIITNSLHYYELEFNKLSINTPNAHSEAQLRLEPNGHCSLVFYNDLLAFLPFKQAQLDVDDDNDVKIIEENNLSLEDQLYNDSIVIPVSNLETSITSIIDCQFLHGYKDPTLAILYHKSHTWAAELSQKKDTVNFMLLSLDLTTGSSTPILNVENLPYDLYEIQPLKNGFINGVLLIGSNEIVYLDNSGGIKGVGLNEFWKDCTDLKLNDQSGLNLFLEECYVDVLPSSNMNGLDEIIIIDQFNNFYYLEFKLDGKLVKDLKISESYKPENLILVNTKTISKWDDYLFIGNFASDSVLLKKSDIDTVDEQIEESKKKNDVSAAAADDDDDDDDLYADETTIESQSIITILNYKKTDSLINNGPISSFTLGKLSSEETSQGLPNPNYDNYAIVATTGEEQSGGLTCFKPSITPQIKSSLKFNNINKTWNLLNKYLITTDLLNFRSEIFLINESFRNYQTLDFKNNSITINIGTLFNSQRIVQVSLTNIYLFDLNFKKLLQINVDFEILSAKILDPFILITSSKGDVKIFEIESKKGRKLNKVKTPNALSDMILTGGNITQTSIIGNDDDQEYSNSKGKKTVFLVTTINNQVLVFDKNHNEKVFHVSNVNKLSEILEVEEFNPVSGLVPDPFIKELELLEIGDDLNKEEFLILLTIGGELIFYKNFIDEETKSFKFVKIESNLITGAPENIYSNSTVLERKLIPIKLKDQNLVFVTGKQPYFIMKTSKSLPKIFKFTSNSAISICKIYKDHEFMYIDNQKNARICQIDFQNDQFDYTQNLPIEKVSLHETVNSVTFHEASKLFILSTLSKIPYDAKDEEDIPIVGTEESKPKAFTYQSTIKLINPKNWFVVDTLELPVNNVVTSLKSMNLTISLRGKKKKEFLVIGIGKYRIEDLTVYGEYNIQDIISIVPDPTKPEVNFKFKEISKEHVRGAVTAITEISGRFLASQGQKVLIRDMQQDNTTVPVAFYDMPTFITDSKSFGNLLLLADSFKSLFLFGFDAEPYRLLLLGKDLQEVNISSVDFIIFKDEIYFLVGDDDENLQLLSYDPEDVKSMMGQKLILKNKFKNNTLTTAIKMLPHKQNFQNVGVNTDGSLFKVLPIDEDRYRRLYVLQQQISDKVAHHCGLNPKSNRYEDNEIGFKPMLEFGMLKRWFNYLNLDKRLNFSAKVGKNAYLEIWKDFVEIETSLEEIEYGAGN